MAVILLTWNPQRSNDFVWSPEYWDEAMVERTRRSHRVAGTWSIGQRREGIVPGDRAYLLRQGPHGRGIVATARIVSEPYLVEGWRNPQEMMPYINIEWLSALPLENAITPEELESIAPEYKWRSVFQSGRDISAHASVIDDAFARRLASLRLPEVKADDPLDPEFDNDGEASIASLVEELRDQAEAMSEDELRDALTELGYDNDDLSSMSLEDLRDDYVEVALDGWLDDDDLSSVENPPEVEVLAQSVGFGSADENKRVESAAVSFVTDHLRRQNFAVTSVEEQKCGWDLTAVRGDEEIHVEVKGARGDQPTCFLTQNEFVMGRHDPAWRLYVVTNALGAGALHEFSFGEVEAAAAPIAYRLSFEG